MFWCSLVGADRPPKQAMPVAQGDLGLCVLWSLPLSLQSVPRCKQSGFVCLKAEQLMFWCCLVGTDRPLKEAMPVAIACLKQEDLGFAVLCLERKVIRAEKIVDGRVPLPARSGYISENWGTVLEKSRRGRVYPAVFRTRQGESSRRPISCVRFTLLISRYPAVSRFDQGIPCCDVYPKENNTDCILLHFSSLKLILVSDNRTNSKKLYNRFRHYGFHIMGCKRLRT